MRQFAALFRLELRQRIRGMRSTGSRKSFVVMWIFLGISIVSMLASIAISLYSAGAVLKDEPDYHATVISACVVVVQLFLLLTSSAEVYPIFQLKNADSLLPLPVGHGKIYWVKLLATYLSSVALCAAILLCTLAPFAAGAGILSVGYFFGILLAAILAPATSIFICMLIVVPISLVVGKTKSNLLFIILRLLIIVGAVALGMAIGEIGHSSVQPDFSGTEQEIALQSVKYMVDSLRPFVNAVVTDCYLGAAMTATSVGAYFGGIGIFSGISLALAALFTFVPATFYGRFLSDCVERGNNVKKRKSMAKTAPTKRRGLNYQLFLAEAKSIFRDRQFLSGVILFAIFPLILVFIGLSLSTEGEFEFNELFVHGSYQIFCLYLMFDYSLFICSTNVLLAHPFSREAKNLSMLKSMPLSAKQILRAKITFAALPVTFSAMCGFVVMVTLFGLLWYGALMMCLAQIVLSIGVLYLAAHLDLKFPMLNWTNFGVQAQNGKSSWLTVLIVVACAFAIAIFAVVSFFLRLSTPLRVTIFAATTLIASAIFALLSRRFTLNRCEKAYDEIM